MQKTFDLFILAWEKYRIEVIFSLISALILIFSIIIYFKSSQGSDSPDFTLEEESQSLIAKPNPYNASQKFTIDLSGAVKEPDVYEVTPGTRIKDVISLAKGLSIEADREFFARNFNLARLVKDQEKIHIPSKYEIYLGVYKEPARLVDFTQPQVVNYIQPSPPKININKANLNELDELPGIGAATAQKLITNRPYTSIEELLTKKILKSNIFDKIKDQISTN